MIVVFGGVASSTASADGKVLVLHDTWEWSQVGGWIRRTPQASPSPRQNASIAYDPATHAVLLYGGSRVDGGTVKCDDFGQIFCSTDTWSWNGTAWTQMRPSRSPDRGPSAMAFDNASERMILYGFALGTFSTWTWDGTIWSEVTGQAGSPEPGRVVPQMAFDRASGHVLLFGGFSQGGGDLLRMWSWNANRWTRMEASAPGSYAAATDSKDGGLLAYRGPFYQGTATEYRKEGPSETWHWNGSNWTQLPTNHDPDIYPMGMFDDPKNDRVLLFGAPYARGGDLQVWAWSGSDWNRLT